MKRIIIALFVSATVAWWFHEPEFLRCTICDKPVATHESNWVWSAVHGWRHKDCAVNSGDLDDLMKRFDRRCPVCETSVIGHEVEWSQPDILWHVDCLYGVHAKQQMRRQE